jgi:HAD superfamily hydrolase (TIGR01509 family)
MIKAILTDFNYVLFVPGDTNSAQTIGGYTLNQALFDFYKEISSYVKIYVLTGGMLAGSPEVKETILSTVTDIYFTAKLGLTKAHESIYPQILSIIHCEPQEVIFIDDTIINIEAAKAAGLHTVHYQSNPQATSELRNIIQNN